MGPVLREGESPDEPFFSYFPPLPREGLREGSSLFFHIAIKFVYNAQAPINDLS